MVKIEDGSQIFDNPIIWSNDFSQFLLAEKTGIDYYQKDASEIHSEAQFLEDIRYITSEDEKNRINLALQLMYFGHQGQKRHTGEPHSVHCMRTATTLARMNLDADTLISGLLHDVLEDSEANGYPINEHEIQAAFGQEVLTIVKGCRNSEYEISDDELEAACLSEYGKPLNIVSLDERKSLLDRLTLAKLYRLLSGEPDTDPRSILVKLSDRLDNIRTIFGKASYLSRHKIASETFEVHSHLAKLIGEERLRAELSDLSFEVLNPRRFHQIINTLFMEANMELPYNDILYYRYDDVRNALIKMLKPDTHRHQLRKALIGELNLFGIHPEIEVSLPSITALHVINIKQKERKQFSASDIYLKADIILGDDDFESRRQLHEAWLINLMSKIGYSYKREKIFRLARDDNEFTLSFEELISGRQIKVRVISRSAFDTYDSHIADNYRKSSPRKKSQAEWLLEKLKHDFMLLTGADRDASVMSVMGLLSSLRDLGGVRVEGNRHGDAYIFPLGSTVLDFAWAVRQQHIEYLIGFRLADDPTVRTDFTRKLKEGDRIVLVMGRKSQIRDTISPEWLQANDPLLIRFLSKFLYKKYLEFSKTDRETFYKWQSSIRHIGYERLRAMTNTGIIVFKPIEYNIDKSYPKSTYLEGKLLERIAFGDVDDTMLTEIAGKIDEFISENYVLDIIEDLDLVNGYDEVFKSECSRMGIVLSSIDSYSDKEKNVRRHRICIHQDNPIDKILKLFDRLAQTPHLMGGVLLDHMQFFSNHIISSESLQLAKYFQDLQNANPNKGKFVEVENRLHGYKDRVPKSARKKHRKKKKSRAVASV
jgi:hypothetical protein